MEGSFASRLRIGHGVRCARTRKKRFVVEVPYVPGEAAVQVTKSALDSRMMFTGPPESAGMTTALLGRKESSALLTSIVQNALPLPFPATVMFAGPGTTIGSLPFGS